MKKKMPNNF